MKPVFYADMKLTYTSSPTHPQDDNVIECRSHKFPNGRIVFVSKFANGKYELVDAIEGEKAGEFYREYFPVKNLSNLFHLNIELNEIAESPERKP